MTRWWLAARVAAAVLAGVLIVAVLAAPADPPDIVDQRAPDVSAIPYVEEQP